MYMGSHVHRDTHTDILTDIYTYTCTQIHKYAFIYIHT